MVDQRWTYDTIGRVTEQELTAGYADTLLTQPLNGPYAVTTSYSEDVADGGWDITHLHASGLQQDRDVDGGGRVIGDVLTTGFGPMRELDYAWSGRLYEGRTASGTLPGISESATYDPFGARIGWNYGDAQGMVASIDLERDVLGRVRREEKTFGHAYPSVASHKVWWKGYEYDLRGALTGAWDVVAADAATFPANSVGYHDAATNLSVRAVAQGLPGSSARFDERVREPKVGGLKEINRFTQNLSFVERVWEAKSQTPAAAGAGRRAGHQIDEVRISGVPYMMGQDARGRLTDALDLNIHYDGMSRITHVDDAGSSSTLASYLYDGDGRLALRETDQGVEVFNYLGESMVAAFDAQANPQWVNVWGPAHEDHLVYTYDFVNGRDISPITDHRNSVVGLYDETSGAMVAIHDYSPEGLLTTYDGAENPVCDEREGASSVCATSGIPFAFNSQWRDETTGLVFMRNRWYAPQLGEFLTHDPLEYVDSYNPYAFAALDPINMWDPWGLSASTMDLIGEFGRQAVDHASNEAEDAAQEKGLKVKAQNGRAKRERRELSEWTPDEMGNKLPNRVSFNAAFDIAVETIISEALGGIAFKGAAVLLGPALRAKIKQAAIAELGRRAKGLTDDMIDDAARAVKEAGDEIDLDAVLKKLDDSIDDAATGPKGGAPTVGGKSAQSVRKLNDVEVHRVAEELGYVGKDAVHDMKRDFGVNARKDFFLDKNSGEVLLMPKSGKGRGERVSVNLHEVRKD